MANTSTGTTLRSLFRLGKHYLKSRRDDNSHAGEYSYLKTLINRLNLTNGYVVDIAASDGVSQSSTLGFFRDPEWKGLAVEMDPVKFSKLAFIYANFPSAKLARGRVTPNNVSSILHGFEVPIDFTLLNLDIDSYDLYVMDQLLKAGFRPKIISMEINEKIPPPIYFTVEYDDNHYWKEDHFYGCSLTAASETVKPFGYKLESLQYNNAIFIHVDACAGLIDDVDVETAYNAGYRNQPSRKKLFPWNSNVECLLECSPKEGIDFLSNFFASYRGQFTLRC